MIALLAALSLAAQAAELADKPNPAFFGDWAFERCDQRSVVDKEKASTRAKLDKTEPPVLTINAATFTPHSEEAFNPRSAIRLRRTVVDAQAYTAGALKGDRVAIALVVRQLGKTEPKKATMTSEEPVQDGMLTSIFRTYTLTDEKHLVQVRRGHSSQLYERKPGNWTLEDESYDVSCYYHRKD